MWVLLRTYLDIIALRKGPEAIPASWLVLAISFAMLGVFWVFQIAVLENLVARHVIVALFGYALALAFYGVIVFLSGHGRRLLPALSSIVACGSIISAVAVSAALLLSPLFGQGVAANLGTLILFWSVPVKGHIVARTIEQHWFVGITIAMSALILRFGIDDAFASAA